MSYVDVNKIGDWRTRMHKLAEPVLGHVIQGVSCKSVHTHLILKSWCSLETSSASGIKSRSSSCIILDQASLGAWLFGTEAYKCTNKIAIEHLISYMNLRSITEIETDQAICIWIWRSDVIKRVTLHAPDIKLKHTVDAACIQAGEKRWEPAQEKSQWESSNGGRHGLQWTSSLCIHWEIEWESGRHAARDGHTHHDGIVPCWERRGN